MMRNGVSQYAGRSTRRYRALRTKFRTWCAEYINHDGTTGAHCWLCGKPIDYDLPSDHPDAWSLDHATPISIAPELAEDPTNFRPSHLDCNKRRGAGDPFIELGTPSEDW